MILGPGQREELGQEERENSRQTRNNFEKIRVEQKGEGESKEEERTRPGRGQEGKQREERRMRRNKKAVTSTDWLQQTLLLDVSERLEVSH